MAVSIPIYARFRDSGELGCASVTLDSSLALLTRSTFNLNLDGPDFRLLKPGSMQNRGLKRGFHA